ncbi:MAG: hemerythrin domain-containing protein [Myxococcales bacterium]|nr:hemerythrin domain-containing protein [Myxococcales bacterium]MCB9732748.1 hemerythrin domain-containing protein [Deltaproteobacteria bacterium]
MRPSELRTRMLAEHDDLKQRIVSIRGALTTRGGELALSAELKARIERFSVALTAHMAHEEAYLAPALRQSTNWRDQNLNDLRAHHDAQREKLRVLMLALRDPEVPAEVIIHDVSMLLEEVEADVAEEDAQVLTTRMLRDDVVSIDASDG